jgi:hypothetical protein
VLVRPPLSLGPRKMTSYQGPLARTSSLAWAEAMSSERSEVGTRFAVAMETMSSLAALAVTVLEVVGAATFLVVAQEATASLALQEAMSSSADAGMMEPAEAGGPM